MTKNKKIVIIVIAAILIIIGLPGILYLGSRVSNEVQGSDIGDDNRVITADNDNNDAKDTDDSENQVDLGDNNPEAYGIYGFPEDIGDAKIENVTIANPDGSSYEGSLTLISTGDNAASSSNNQGNTADGGTINMVLEYTFEPASKDRQSINRSLETDANILAEYIAGISPKVGNATIKFNISQLDAEAVFTYTRDGDNMFLQEFKTF